MSGPMREVGGNRRDRLARNFLNTMKEQMAVVTDEEETPTNLWQRMVSKNPSEQEWAYHSLANFVLDDTVDLLEKLASNDAYTNVINSLSTCFPDDLGASDAVERFAASIAVCAFLNNFTANVDPSQHTSFLYNGIPQPLFTLLFKVGLLNTQDQALSKYRDTILTQIICILRNLLYANEQFSTTLCTGQVITLLNQFLTPNTNSQTLIFTVLELYLQIVEMEEYKPMLEKSLMQFKAMVASQANTHCVRLYAMTLILSLIDEDAKLPMLNIISPTIEAVLTTDTQIAWSNYVAAEQELEALRASIETTELTIESNNHLQTELNKVNQVRSDWSNQLENQIMALSLLRELFTTVAEEHEFTEMGETDHHGEDMAMPASATFFLNEATLLPILNIASHCSSVPLKDIFTDRVAWQTVSSAIETFLVASYTPAFLDLPNVDKGCHSFWQACTGVLRILHERMLNIPMTHGPISESYQQTLLSTLEYCTAGMGRMLALAKEHQKQAEFEYPDQADTDLLVGLIQCGHEKSRGNAVACLAVLPSLSYLPVRLGLTPDALLLESMRPIMQAMVEDVKGEGWTLVEAVNAVFDLFDESNSDAVAETLQLWPQFGVWGKALAQKLQNKKKLDLTLLDKLDETQVNYKRFVKYKHLKF